VTVEREPGSRDLWTLVEKKRLSRGWLLKASGLGLAALAGAGVAETAIPRRVEASAGFPFYPAVQGTYTTETGLQMAQVLHTMAHFATSLLTAAVKSKPLGLSSNSLLLAVVQAAIMEEDLHAEIMDTITAPYLGVPTGTPLSAVFFQGSSGQNATLPNGASYIRFTLPDAAILSDQKTFFTTWESIQSLSVAAYIAAVREFAELGQPMLAKWSAQTLGIEAEHRVLARAALAVLGDASSVPPNNKGFETEHLLYVRDAAKTLIDRGFWGGSGTAIPFANPAAARTAAGPMATTCTPLYPGQYGTPGAPCGPASANGVIQAVPNNAVSTNVSTIPGER
jgi:hypothetical protein